MGGEFRLLHDQQSFGLPVPEALRNFALRVPVLDARFFVTAVLTQRDAGGNLSELLDNLSAIIRDRFRVKRQVRVISAHGRITGWVLGGLTPALVMVFMYHHAGELREILSGSAGRPDDRGRGAASTRRHRADPEDRQHRVPEVRMPIDLGLALAAVFLSVALVSASAIWLVLGWSSPERRQIRRLSRDRSRVGATPDPLADRRAERAGQATSAGRSEIPERHVAPAPAARDRRVPVGAGGGGLCRVRTAALRGVRACWW